MVRTTTGKLKIVDKAQTVVKVASTCLLIELLSFSFHNVWNFLIIKKHPREHEAITNQSVEDVIFFKYQINLEEVEISNQREE